MATNPVTLQPVPRTQLRAPFPGGWTDNKKRTHVPSLAHACNGVDPRSPGSGAIVGEAKRPGKPQNISLNRRARLSSVCLCLPAGLAWLGLFLVSNRAQTHRTISHRHVIPSYHTIPWNWLDGLVWLVWLVGAWGLVRLVGWYGWLVWLVWLMGRLVVG